MHTRRIGDRLGTTGTEALRRWRDARAAKTDAHHPSDPNALAWIGGSETATGLSVTEDTALAYSAVFCAISLLSETIASLPLLTYRRLSPRGKERAREHPVYPLLHHKANPDMPAFFFREAMQGHALGRGNGYAEIERDGGERPIGLWGIHPARVKAKRGPTGAVVYEVRQNSGGSTTIAAHNMLHVRGLGGDGLVGYSVLRLAREAVGLGLATERFGSSFFGNGIRPSGVLQHPGQLTEEAQARLVKQIESQARGQGNWLKLMVLEEDMKFEQVGIAPDDAQFLETRRFQIAEIARWFRLPPHMLGDLERATFSNIEQQSLNFVIYSLRSWLVRWEQEIKVKLFDASDEYFAEHLVDGLLRGDLQSRYTAYATARQWGWLSADDVREIENQNPLPDGQGEVYLIPLNMVPANQTGKAPEARAETIADRLAKPHMRTLADAAGRIIRMESAAARRAARTPDTFRATVDRFYAGHEATLVRILTPATETCAEVLRAAAPPPPTPDAHPDDPAVLVADLLRTLATAHCQEMATAWHDLAVAAEGNGLASVVATRADELEGNWPELCAADIIRTLTRQVLLALPAPQAEEELADARNP